MTTKTDAARECAEEQIEDELQRAQWIVDGIEPPTEEEWIEILAERIRKHFPPSVPVSKLEEAMKELNETGKHLFSTDLAKLLGKTVDKIQALIAEAKKEPHCERLSDMDLP